MRDKPLTDLADARLLPRFQAASPILEHRLRDRSHAAALDAVLRDEPTGKAFPTRSVKSEAGDLRGIPVIGRGVGGASPGTRPEDAIDRVDRQRALVAWV